MGIFSKKNTASEAPVDKKLEGSVEKLFVSKDGEVQSISEKSLRGSIVETGHEHYEDRSDNNRIFDAILKYISRPNVAAKLAQFSRGLVSKEVILKDIEEYLEDEIGASYEAIEENIKLFEKYEWGYYKLDEAIKDVNVTDITVIDHKHIFIHKRDGTRTAIDTEFRNKDDYKGFIERVLNRNGVNGGTNNAILRFTDTDSNGDWVLRMDVTTEFVTDNKEYRFHIRKTPKEKLTLDFLVNNGSLTRAQADWIIERVQKLESFLICGGNGNGKTTFINAIIEYLPYYTSVLCIQESKELFFSDPGRQFSSMHPVKRSSSGGVEYTMADITKLGLVSDIDVVINGEIKDEAASEFFTVAHNGATVYASVHSETEEDAFIRLSDYAKRVVDYSISEMEYMMRHINNVILIEDKKVKSISTTHWNKETQRIETKRVDI